LIAPLIVAVGFDGNNKKMFLHDFSSIFHFLGMGSTSGYDVTHPITVLLDGSTSYHSWSQNMIVFLKGRILWYYVTGAIPKPIPKPLAKGLTSDTVLPVDDFEVRLEE
jgi:hypothetical protein